MFLCGAPSVANRGPFLYRNGFAYEKFCMEPGDWDLEIRKSALDSELDAVKGNSWAKMADFQRKFNSKRFNLARSNKRIIERIH